MFSGHLWQLLMQKIVQFFTKAIIKIVQALEKKILDIFKDVAKHLEASVALFILGQN